MSEQEQEPIRILRVIARLNVGGPTQHVAYLSSELDRRGYQTTLVAGRVGAGEGSMEDFVLERGVQPRFIETLRREISPLYDAVAVWRLVRLIRSQRPHVLHTHTAKAGTIGRVAAALSGSARPQAVVHTFHGHVLRGYFGPAATTVFRLVERVLARGSDSLIAVSPEVRDDLVRMKVAPRDRIAVIRLGLDLDARTSADPNARERTRASLGAGDRFVVGWLGRMTEIKRVDDLLHAFALLRSQGVDGVLVLVGDGPLRPNLMRRAEQLGVAGDCRFVGYQADVAPLYSALDVVALTSANEGTPVTLIEALAAGRPVVSTDVGGVRDVVEDGQSGLLVPPGDVDAVADALARLAGDPELRERMGHHASLVRERYGVGRLVDDIDELYRSLLQRSPVAHAVEWNEFRPLRPVLGGATIRSITRGTRPLRVILLSQYFPPEVGATQSRMQSFAEYLAARGHTVTVISEFPNHPHGVMPERYRHHLIEDDRSNPYRVLRVWVRAREEKTQTSRVAFYLSYMAMATAVAPLAGRADVVLATSPPLFTGIAGAFIARANRAPFVLDVRDLWPAAAFSLGQISSGIPLRTAAAVERWLYKEASAVVAVTGPFCAHIDALRNHGSRTALIPNGTLDQFFEVEAINGTNGSRPYRVTFAGTHGIAQALFSVLDAADLLREEPVEFSFVGEGPVKELLVREAAERGLRNVEFKPQVPLEQVVSVLESGDALLVPLSAHETFADFVPSKMIDFMAAGRPVILAARGEAARLLERAGGGLSVEPEDPKALADAVQWLRTHPGDAERMAARGRQFARTRMRGVQAERLEQVLLDVVGDR